MIYPIGAVYISTVFANPQDLFDFGEWEFLPDRFLLGAGNTFQIGTTGGTVNHAHSAGSLEALIGSPYGNPQGLGFVASNKFASVGANSVYNVQGASYSSGGARSHNTMIHGSTDTASTLPPYLVVYMWKRIA